MKKLVLTTAILAIGAVAAQADMFTNALTGVRTDTSTFGSTVGTATATTLITDDAPPPQTLVVTINDLNLDDQGGLANDSIALTFTVTGDGQNLQVNGWISSGGTTLNAGGEFVKLAYTSMAITADDMTGVSASFLGFTAVDLGSWAANHIAVVNGVTQGDNIASTVDLTIDGNALNDTSVTVAYVDGISNGSFRPSFYNLELEIDAPVTNIPEPATLGMVAVFGGAVLFIRRKLMM